MEKIWVDLTRKSKRFVMEKRQEHVKQKNDQEIWNGKETERCDVEKQWNIGHDIEIGKSDVEKRHEKVIDMEKRWEDLTWKKKDKLYMEKKN